MSAKSKRVAESEFDASIIVDSILWQEWSDAALNKENWGSPKSDTNGLFLDTQLVQLPPSLTPYSWIRAKNLRNLTEPLSLFVANPEYPDLITNNKHILHSEFARWFISALINLQYCGRDGLEISGENGNFVWNGRYQSWKGWMNVYSMCKAGKGTQHRPIVNPNGKYIVRLYFLGAWRRIVVDDMIPVNVEGLPVLPRTANDHELWPMLLSKALLKLCSLTWSRHREIVDFHPVSCLTGWVCLRLKIDYMSPRDKWDFLRKYADHFEWEPEATEQENVSKSKMSSDGKKSKDTVRTKKSKETEKSRKTRSTDRSKKSKDSSPSKKSKDRVKKQTALIKPQPVTLFLGLDNMKTLSSEAVPGLSPCWSHFVYVAQTRDLPLDPKDMKPPLPRWKLYRWLKWAIEEGIIDPVEYFVPIRSLKVVSPLKTFEKSVIDRFNDADMEEHLQKEEIDRRTTSEKSDRKRKHRDKSKESSGKTSKKSPKKTPKDSQKKTAEKIPDVPMDISFWVDFNKMEPYVRDVHFFYKLDLFQYTAKVSDRLTSRLQDHRSETKKGSKTGSRRSSRSKEPEFVDVYCWPQKMSPTRNEPLYIFTDSLEEKFFLIDFSTFQVRVDPRASTVPMSGEGDRKTSSSSIPMVEEDYLIVEKHNWFRRPKKTYSLVYIQTAGTRSTVMELKPGRYLLRVYCRSESNCFLTISSDTSFQVGDRRRMYQLMSTESEMIDQAVRHISNSVSRAYQSFGTETYQEALMAYYDSYMPPPENIRNRSKAFYDNIHECFIDEQVQLIRKILPADQLPGVLWSLRVFFLNPIIGMQCFNPMLMMLKNMRESRTSKYSPTNFSQERFNHSTPVDHHAATIIQSFFKMLMIRKYRRIHDPSHAQHQLVLENLAKVAELFDYNKRESLAAQMLRNILRQFDRLQDVYPCTRDFEYTLQVQELTGTLGNVKSNQWLPMARFTVNPRITETVFAGVDLFVDLPRYSVRVFDNETEHEMLRVVNNVVPTRYHHTSLGYTIFGYGWSEEKVFEELTWTMTIITMKGQPVFYSANDETSPSAITLPVLVTEELSNVYIPNASKYISKWIVKVASPTLASFRLRTSYDKVKIKFRVMDEKGRVLTQVKGTSVVILPIAYLGLQREESQLQVNVENNVEGRHFGSIGANHDKLSNGDESYSIGDTVEEKLESKVSQESMNRRTYYAEAFVLEDSWPLTKSEWAAVMEIKSKVTGSFAKTKSSVSITNKISKSDGSRTRKGSKQSVDGGQAVETPRWVLQVVTDSGSGLEITQDRTKEKEIAQMKEAWAKENPDSLQRGRELREAFIAKHEILPETSTLNVIKKSSTQTVKFSTKRASRATVVDCCLETSATKIEKRTTKPCQSLRRLPAVDLSSYKIKEDEEEVSWLKTSHDEEVLSNIRALNIIYAEEDYNHVLEEMNGLLKSRRKRYRELFGKHKDSFWEKRALLEDVYEARKVYIGTTKSVSVQSTKRSARSKKSTKSKKV